MRLGLLARMVRRLFGPARVAALLSGRAYFRQLQAVDHARFAGRRYGYR